MLQILLMLAALAGPPPPAGAVTITAPKPYEVWDGHVAGRAPAGTLAVTVTCGDRRWVVPLDERGRFDHVLGPVPPGERSIAVAGENVGPLWGVPSGSLVPLAAAQNAPALSHRLRAMAGEATARVGVYVHAWNGTAAAYNAGAEFEAASTLKLPIMLTLMSRTRRELSGSPYWDPMRRITRYSDNAAANQLLVAMGGSEERGAARMVALMRAVGLSQTFMVSGYLTGAGGGPPPVTVEDPPPSAYKHTTAAEMGRLAAMLADAAAGRGPLRRHGVTQHEARELLYLMLHAEDPGLVAAGAGRLPVAHKIGWLTETNNDVAVVYTHHGPVAIAILTEGSQDGSAEDYGEAATKVTLDAARDSG